MVLKIAKKNIGRAIFLVVCLHELSLGWAAYRARSTQPLLAFFQRKLDGTAPTVGRAADVTTAQAKDAISRGRGGLSGFHVSPQMQPLLWVGIGMMVLAAIMALSNANGHGRKPAKGRSK